MSKPIRIQTKRTAGFKLPENTVYVGRPSIFGNPYRPGDYLEHFDGDMAKAQAACVESFRGWLDGSVEGREMKIVFKAKLRGKNLACWCKPGTPCHADVLLEIANS